MINDKLQDDVTIEYLKPSCSGHPKVILSRQGGPALALRPVSPAKGLESSCQQRRELWEFFQRACGGAQDYNRFTSKRRTGIKLSCVEVKEVPLQQDFSEPLIGVCAS